MMIADQCRSLACQLFAASLDPWTPPHVRRLLAHAAQWNECMAVELDRQNITTATGAELDALTVALFGERLPRAEAIRRLGT